MEIPIVRNKRHTLRTRSKDDPIHLPDGNKPGLRASILTHGVDGMHFTVLVMPLMDGGSNIMLKSGADTCLSKERKVLLVPCSSCLNTESLVRVQKNRTIMGIQDCGWIYQKLGSVSLWSCSNRWMEISIDPHLHQHHDKT
ncbi:expressed unknown protein [Seminavis robusta]|uniref:Uncharacterized protein n=1 Tax=Seminavis robusta TaxID=568900 RepID=A0A9N8D9V7_9STRA|nr:expressed unknown protein [Seminavis robusta]|eukprot:Sro52_g031150.1 n/a (141) ;mRNA; r:115136-115637